MSKILFGGLVVVFAAVFWYVFELVLLHDPFRGLALAFAFAGALMIFVLSTIGFPRFGFAGILGITAALIAVVVI